MVGGNTGETRLNYRLVWSGTNSNLNFNYINDEKSLELVFSFAELRKAEEVSRISISFTFYWGCCLFGKS